MKKIAYSLLALISLFVFFIFRPYSFIDHSNTKIICDQSKTNYKLGENFIYMFNESFDPLIEKKVRNLCGSSNYRIVPIYEKESSYVETLILSLSVFVIGIYFLKNIKESLILSLLIGFVLFFIFLKNPASKIYCKRQMASRINNFKKSAYGFGWERIQQEQDRMNYVLDQAFKKCLEKEGVK